jgi:hypothetical protein
MSGVNPDRFSMQWIVKLAVARKPFGPQAN